MTAKEQINEKLRLRIIGMYGGFAFTFAGVISASQLGKYAAFPIVLGFAIYFASMLSIRFGICAYCGADFDREVES